MKRIALYIAFLIIAFACLVLSFNQTKITGDGSEYLTMSVSFKNHLSFNRTEEDFLETKQIIKKSFTAQEMEEFHDKNLKTGYYKAIPEKGSKEYSYHFWAYSLICSPLVALFTFFDINALDAFKVTNLLLILVMFYWILFRNNAISEKNRLFITLFLCFSPLWFYYKWTHPEVFTFTLLMIGLIDYYNNRKYSALFFTSLASVQNPAAAVVPFFIMIKEVVNLIKKFSKETTKKFIVSSLISFIVFIPYIFYYINFKKLSLIGAYATNLNSISVSKILSLFFDLNFGLAIYCPILICMTIYGILKKDKLAIISLLTVILFAVIDSAQLNWNPGIHLINRYSYWMIPVLLFGCFNIINTFSDKVKKIIIVINLILILPWFFFSKSMHASTHKKFHPLAVIVLNTSPSLYNPQEEIFAERALQKEAVSKDEYPITYYENGQPLKTLHYDEKKKKYYYQNYNPNFNKINIKIKHKQYIYYIGLNGISKEKRK